MGLPIYTFWELSRNASRIKADNDMRTLRTVGSAFGGDPAALSRELANARGEIVEQEEYFDSEGFQKLRFLTGR